MAQGKATIGGLTMVNYKDNNGALVDEDSLTSQSLTKLDISPTLFKLFGDYFQKGRLTQMLFGTKEEGKNFTMPNMDKSVTSKQFAWRVMGRMGKLVHIAQDGPNSGGTSTNPYPPSQGNKHFTLIFEEPYFFEHDTIRFGWSENNAIVKGMREVSAGTEYTLVMQKPGASIQNREAYKGFAVAKGANVQPEFSEEGYSREFYPYRMENWTTVMRASKTISGDAHHEKTIIDFKKGSKTGPSSETKGKLWFYEAERQLYQQFYDEIVYTLYWGQSTMDQTQKKSVVKGTNKYAITTGDGLFEYLRNSRHFYYEPGNLNFDNFGEQFDYLHQLGQGTEDTQFILYAGRALYREVNYMAREFLNQNNTDGVIYVSGKGKEYDVGADFVNLTYPLGINVKMTHEPAFDEPNWHGGAIHPRTGKPMYSYTGVVLDQGKYEGEPNVSVIPRYNGDTGVNRSFQRWAVWGSTPPPGQTEKSSFGSSGIDGFQIHLLSEFGLKIINPYRCMVIKAHPV